MTNPAQGEDHEEALHLNIASFAAVVSRHIRTTFSGLSRTSYLHTRTTGKKSALFDRARLLVGHASYPSILVFASQGRGVEVEHVSDKHVSDFFPREGTRDRLWSVGLHFGVHRIPRYIPLCLPSQRLISFFLDFLKGTKPRRATHKKQKPTIECYTKSIVHESGWLVHP